MFGLLPFLHVAKLNVHDSSKEGGRTTGGVRVRKWTAALMAGELAMTLMLLTVTGWLWRGFVDESRAEGGLDTHNVAIMSIALPPSNYGLH